jgi:hypothetical protein
MVSTEPEIVSTTDPEIIMMSTTESEIVSTVDPEMTMSTADPGISPISPTTHTAIGGNKSLL